MEILEPLIGALVTLMTHFATGRLRIDIHITWHKSPRW